MPVDRIHASGGFAATPAKADKATSDKGFRALLGEETAKQPAKPATPATPATPEAPKAEAKPPAIKGEKTDPVEGHRYAEIVAGPRNGMFLNTSGNVRDGQAFTLVERGGFHFHVYGAGEDRKVFRVADGDDDKPPTAA